MRGPILVFASYGLNSWYLLEFITPKIVPYIIPYSSRYNPLHNLYRNPSRSLDYSSCWTKRLSDIRLLGLPSLRLSRFTFSSFCLARNGGMEKNMEIPMLGYSI